MSFRRYFDVIDRLAYRLAGPTAEDRAAGFDLAVASRRFSRRTKAVVDDKLSFTATLMRAGEVAAANRLLAEVERDVRTEEAALIEVVNEVKIEREMNRKPITRVALARMMAAAMLGSTLLATSAVGMAVAGLFEGGGAQTGSSDVEVSGDRDGDAGNDRLAQATRQVRIIPGLKLNMTDAELRRFRELTQGDVNGERLEDFLLGFLPPSLAEKVQLAIGAAYEVMPDDVQEPIVVLSERVNQKRKEATQEDPDATAEPNPSPSDSDDPDEDDSKGSKDDDEGDSNGLPIIGDDDDEG